MHSSRMHTVHCSGYVGGVCPGWVMPKGGWCLPKGGVCLGGCLTRGSVCLGGVCPEGVYTTPLPLLTQFLTHACENITFPQLLLRMVNMYKDRMKFRKKNSSVTALFTKPPYGLPPCRTWSGGRSNCRLHSRLMGISGIVPDKIMERPGTVRPAAL